MFAVGFFVLKVYAALFVFAAAGMFVGEMIVATLNGIAMIVGAPGALAGKVAGEKWRQRWNDLVGWIYVLLLGAGSVYLLFLLATLKHG